MTAPIAIFPTETILIDDDHLYARLLAKGLMHKFKMEITVNPSITHALINEEKDFYFLSDDHGSIDQSIFKEDIGDVFKFLKIRLVKPISVMVADFHMDNHTGLDLFKRIKSPFIYKILISNFIDAGYDDDVTQALNNGVIDAVLDKKRNLDEALRVAIKRGQKNFFSKIASNLIPKKIASDRLLDPVLSNFIWEMIEDLKPTVMNSNPALSKFEFINEKEQCKKIAYVTSTSETNSLLESYQAEMAPRVIREKLRSNNFILACDDPYSIDGDSWAGLLAPARRLKGRKNEYLIGLVEEFTHA